MSGDASILTYVSVAAAGSAWRSLAAGGGSNGPPSQVLVALPLKKKKSKGKKTSSLIQSTCVHARMRRQTGLWHGTQDR